MTEHLQLLLRKAGYHLHTTAEGEVVRAIKEKNCYIALNPNKEEKDAHGRTEIFRLPDGNTIAVLPIPSAQPLVLTGALFSWDPSDSAQPKSCSTPRLLVSRMRVFIKL